MSSVKYVIISGIRSYKISLPTLSALWLWLSSPTHLLTERLYVPGCSVFHLLDDVKSFLFHLATPAAQAGNWRSTSCTPVSKGTGVGPHCMGRGAPGEGESQPWAAGLFVLLVCSRPAHEVQVLQPSCSAKIGMLCPNLLLCLWPRFSAGLSGSETDCWHFSALSVSHDKMQGSTKYLASQTFFCMSGLRGLGKEGYLLFYRELTIKYKVELEGRLAQALFSANFQLIPTFRA